MLAAVTLLAAFPEQADAQRYRRRSVAVYSQRGITMPKHTLRIDVGPVDRALLDSGALTGMSGLRVRHREDDNPATEDTFIDLNAGLAFSVLDSLELGLQMIPVVLAPEADYGELELYVRWRFFASRVFQIGIQSAIQFPTRDDFGLSFGLPFQLAGGIVRFDAGIEVELIFNDEARGGDGETYVHLDAPAALSFNIAPPFYLGFRTGILLTDDDAGYDIFPGDDLLVPLGGFLGYTLPGRGPAVDLTAGFDWYFGGPDPLKLWQLTFGVVGYIPL